MKKQLRYKIIDKYPKGNDVHYNIDDPKPIKPIEIIKKVRKENE